MNGSPVERFVDPIDLNLIVVQQLFDEFDCPREVHTTRPAQRQELGKDVIVGDAAFGVNEEFDGLGVTRLVQMVVAQQSRRVDQHVDQLFVAPLVLARKIPVDASVICPGGTTEACRAGVGTQAI